MPTVTTSYYGIEGTGRTLKEAKAQAADKIEWFMRNYRPRYIGYGGWLLACLPDPDGGARYEILVDAQIGFRDQRGCSICTDMTDAIAGAVSHLAQLCFPEPLPNRLWEEIEDRDTRRRLQSDYAYWSSWQRSYAAAPAGMNDEEKRAWAGAHWNEFRTT